MLAGWHSCGVAQAVLTCRAPSTTAAAAGTIVIVAMVSGPLKPPLRLVYLIAALEEVVTGGK